MEPLMAQRDPSTCARDDEHWTDINAFASNVPLSLARDSASRFELLLR
jgi:hypothetical protein